MAFNYFNSNVGFDETNYREPFNPSLHSENLSIPIVYRFPSSTVFITLHPLLKPVLLWKPFQTA